MARKSPRSNQAWNGSASGSTYESDSTVGTLQNDEDWDDNLLDQEGQYMQETRAFQGNQSLKKGQVFGAGQSSQEHPWTDKDYRRPSEPPLAGSMKRYLTESDPREEFRLGGQPTGNADVAEREDQINLSERRPKSSNEISRSNTVKKTNKGTTTNPSGADGNRSDGAESLDYLSPTKRRKKGNDGAGKTRKNQ